MKNASNLPRSNVSAKHLRWPRLKLASGKAPGYRQAPVWMVVGRMKAQKWSCRSPLMPSPVRPRRPKVGEEIWRVQCFAEGGLFLLIERAAPNYAPDGAAASTAHFLHHET